MLRSLRGHLVVRRAAAGDLRAILRILNEGIEDGLATLETDPKSAGDIATWWTEHDERYAVVVALEGKTLVGWASLNHFSHRCAHRAVADLSIYVARSFRGRGIGFALLDGLVQAAQTAEFHKIVLHAFNGNEPGKRLYQKAGFREVGVFREHGMLAGRYVDIVAMERLLDASR